MGADDLPGSIGTLSAFAGNAGILIRALAYALLLGRQGMHRVGQYATLNANYMAARFAKAGFQLAYPERRATHEFILTFQKEGKELGVSDGSGEAVTRLRGAFADHVLSSVGARMFSN